MNMKAWLKEQQENFDSQIEQAVSGGGDFENPPDGKYVFRLESAELGESKSSGRVQIAWKWLIEECADENWVGKSKFDYDGLEGEKSFFWLGLKMKKLGVDPAQLKITRLQETLDELADQNIVIRGRLKTKKDFQNLQIERVIEDYQSNGKPDDDVPDENEGVDLKVGMDIRVKLEEGEPEKATIVEFKNETNEIVVKVGRKTHTIGIAQVEGLWEE